MLIGQVKDTNSSFIAKALNYIGVRVVSISVVGDDRKDIEHILDRALETSDILILTGGLGPTRDDLTKAILFDYTGARAYRSDPEQEAVIRLICERRGMAMEGLNRMQALVPDTAEAIVNRLGTAPGMWFALPEGSPHGPRARRVIAAFPGVPYETEAMVETLCRKLQAFFELSPIVHKTLNTYGIPESTLSQSIADWEEHLPSSLHLAYLPGPLTGVRLRLSAYGTDSPEHVDRAFDTVRQRLGDAVYGEGEDSLPSVVARLLQSRGATVATAESCTGGYIAHLITASPGASMYYLGSVVSYHNRIKQEVLGVSAEILESEGAVSESCVLQMAAGVQEKFSATYALATSGIAGPGGGTPEKPVGTLWAAVAGPGGVSAEKFSFSASRDVLIKRFSASALNMLRLRILADKTAFLL